MENQTTKTEFVLQGLTDQPDLQLLLFVLFLLIYIVTLVGNVGMIVLIRMDLRLHTPMYFFLSNLAFLDICYSSVITPKTLVTYWTTDKTISFLGCATQMFLFIGLESTECYFLAAMAYDRYVAICNPLLYQKTMSAHLCILLVIVSYIGGFVNSSVHTCLTFQMSFCHSHVIQHYFCDLPPLLKLSCSDTHISEIWIFFFVCVNEITTMFAILVSYTYILATILKIRSAEGRRKAFSTCSSHLAAVTIFYSTVIFTYFKPQSSYTLGQDQVASVFYTMVIPMLNPLIYSLRNKEVKGAVKRVTRRNILSL